MSEQPTQHSCADGSDCNHAAATSDGMTWVTQPTVRMVASTQTLPSQFASVAAELGIEALAEIPKDGRGNVVGAGRTCYYSFDAPNPETTFADDYIKNIIRQRHGSVLQFHQVTVAISTSRIIGRQFTRHHAGFDAVAEVSQRFVNVPPRVCIPSAIQQVPHLLEGLKRKAINDYALYQEAYAELRAFYPRKQAREAARSYLSEAMETTIVLSGNMRAWRNFVEARTADLADIDIRRLGMEVYRVLSAEWPVYFFDAAAVEGAFGLPNVKFEYSKV